MPSSPLRRSGRRASSDAPLDQAPDNEAILAALRAAALLRGSFDPRSSAHPACAGAHLCPAGWDLVPITRKGHARC